MIRLTVVAVGVGVGVLFGAALTGTHYLESTPAADTATAATTLTAGSSLTSANGDYKLVMNANGDLSEESLYDISPIIVEVNDPDGNAYLGGGNGTAAGGNYTVNGALVGSDPVQIWDSGTGGHRGARAVVQTDGNFVIYSSSNAALWSSGTAGHPGARLAVQSDANIVLYNGSQALWANKRVSIVDGHGNSSVNLRNCPGVLDPCGVEKQVPSGTGVTMLCWMDASSAGWSTKPPSNRWFYVVADGTQDELGFMDAGYVDSQIKTPHCASEIKPGQNPPSAPVPLPSNPVASAPVTPPSSAPAPTAAPAPTVTSAPAPVSPATWTETVGGPTHAWTNFSNAGGAEGPTIPTGQSVQVACYVRGFKVTDGNTYWYRIASSPWNSAYYASADAFYNDGATSGSLIGTPFVDPNVRPC